MDKFFKNISKDYVKKKWKYLIIWKKNYDFKYLKLLSSRELYHDF